MIPRLAAAAGRGVLHLARHPQPFVALILAAGLGGWLWHVVRQSDAFEITTIEAPEGANLKIPAWVRGENLWAVDIHALAASLNAQRPDLKWVRVVRVPPHTLRIDVQPRAPTAQVQAGQWHLVDADGFIFPDATPKPLDGVTILKGVQEGKGGLKPGRENQGPKLRSALRLAATLRTSAFLSRYQITELDLSNPGQVNFVLNDDMEIRCGSEEELAAQLSRLRVVLQRVSRESVPVRYIDVRFPDPVVRPKT